uniref:(California timema) hypothetical protein n=1 Tax=Timema californicum TaxID=61474 RepID=A0A7R9P7U3_TIMCA|nr:unnamed protein product [Timema californicum]
MLPKMRSALDPSLPFVIHFKELINTSDSLCILLEMMEGGDLYARIDPENTLTEDTLKLIFFQTVSAVKYLHDQGITHRDLKRRALGPTISYSSPVASLELIDSSLLTSDSQQLGIYSSPMASLELIDSSQLTSDSQHSVDWIADDGKIGNILLNSNKPNTLIKVTDFGVSKKETNMQTVIGTLFFIAPEILKQHFQQRTYTNQVDIWSLGVILFNWKCIVSVESIKYINQGSFQVVSRLFGYSSEEPVALAVHLILISVVLYSISSDLPFKNPAQTLMSDFSFDENPKWKETSPDVKDLISEMLIKDPVDRITLDEIFRHPWLQDEEMKKTLYTLMWERQVLQFHEMARDVLGPIKWKDVRT